MHFLYRSDNRKVICMKDNKPVLVILAIFLPFLAVYFASEGNPKQMVRT